MKILENSKDSYYCVGNMVGVIYVSLENFDDLVKAADTAAKWNKDPQMEHGPYFVVKVTKTYKIERV